MEDLKEALLARFNTMEAKLESMDKLRDHLTEIDSKLGNYAEALEQMQVKVNLTMDSMSKSKEAQEEGVRLTRGSGLPLLTVPRREEQSIIGMPTGMPCGMPPEPPPLPPKPHSSTVPKVTFPPPTPEAVLGNPSGQAREDGGEEKRRSWMSKMDFPKFDGTDARIWLDTCNTFFQLYSIAEGFKVSAATMYMRGNAAHWYQSYKIANPWHSWPTFSAAVILKFEGNFQRDKTRELLTLKQSGTVEEYKRHFDMLVYQVKLYDPHVGGMMLVQRFILGLKEELRAAVEVQLPDTVAEAASFAAIQESVIERGKYWPTKSYHKKTPPKTDVVEHSIPPTRFEKGELWKAKQLKECVSDVGKNLHRAISVQ